MLAQCVYHRRVTLIDAPPGVEPTTSPLSLEAAACLFRGFSDASRLGILRHLVEQELRVVDLTARLGLAQSTVSGHLTCLKGCGLVTSRPDGRSTRWSLAHPDAVLELLSAAERILGLTGEAVALCPTFGSAAAGSEPVGGRS
ncbi:hypothetical protein GCM10027425_28270 [Alteromonas gracilis]